MTWIFLLLTVGSGYAFESAPTSGPIREIHVGMALHDVDNLWSGESRETGPDICAELVFNRLLFQLFSIPVYPNAGITLNTKGHTSKIYGGVALQWELASGFFFSTGVGLALHNGKLNTHEENRKSLGSRVLFRIPVEIGYAIDLHHRLALAFDHVSNAHLASPNEGLDTLGLVYEYRF